jgi:hypothetical protein
VTDLQIEYASLSLRAATFGRGLWESLLAGAGNFRAVKPSRWTGEQL